MFLYAEREDSFLESTDNFLICFTKNFKAVFVCLYTIVQYVIIKFSVERQVCNTFDIIEKGRQEQYK
jgi:hypothetical protein